VVKYVFTFARAGYGHLRVAYALMEGLPPGDEPIFFSSTDEATTALHRLSSTNPVMRELADALQYGLPERVFTALYTRILRRKAAPLLPQLAAMINALPQKPDKVVFVSTHFGLAHQIAGLKVKLSELTGTKVKLVVVVTDDSPQRAWVVPGAELTLVPSETTRLRLRSFGFAQDDRIRIEVCSYPVSPKLGAPVALHAMRARQKQAKGESDAKVLIPVSGAAVGLPFIERLIAGLSALEKKFEFTVISGESSYTNPFLRRLKKNENVTVLSSKYDRDVVLKYEEILQKETFTFEITKPSEQAFKALFEPPN
jgi:hypothetical protein